MAFPGKKNRGGKARTKTKPGLVSLWGSFRGAARSLGTALSLRSGGRLRETTGEAPHRHTRDGSPSDPGRSAAKQRGRLPARLVGLAPGKRTGLAPGLPGGWTVARRLSLFPGKPNGSFEDGSLRARGTARRLWLGVPHRRRGRRLSALRRDLVSEKERTFPCGKGKGGRGTGRGSPGGFL